MSDLWSVTVPGYATGAGTVLLVVVTAATIWNDRRKESRRETQEALRDARKVFGIAERLRASSILDEPDTGPRHAYVLTVINASADTIFDVGADGQSRRATLPVWVVDPGQLPNSFMLPGERRSVSGQWKIRVGDGTVERLAALPEQPDFVYAQMEVVVSWTDGRGIGWTRAGSAEPERLPGS